MRKAFSFFFILFCVCVTGYSQSDAENVDYKLHEYGDSEILIKQIPNLIEEVNSDDQYYFTIDINSVIIQKYELILKHPDLSALWRDFLSIDSDKEARHQIEIQILELISRI